MNKKAKRFIYNLLAFAVFFFTTKYLLRNYTGLEGFWIPFTAFVISTILAPKFQTVTTKDGEKLFMSWIFVKGIKEIK